ncbi:MAG TPA: hypothetical protein VMV45_09490 [Casimicrobiaceae bacterium]|nr:hypothetical protein [Casimicrobiaceae bacterium]
MLRKHLKHLLVSLLVPLAAALASTSARATDYTDLWYTASESGQGYNVVQSDNFLFITFFIYGPDKQPTWVSAQLTLDNTGNYNGGLYKTQGTYYALPWNNADHPPAQQVGTASFQPSTANAYQATLVYTVNGVGTIVKPIERQNLTDITVAGSYVGGQSGAYSQCNSSANNGSYIDTFSLLGITQTTANVATLTFSYDSGANCTLSGPLEQHGTLYRIANASYACTGSIVLNANAVVFEFKATSLGIEGRFSAPLSGGCREDAQFSGVLR